MDRGRTTIPYALPTLELSLALKRTWADGPKLFAIAPIKAEEVSRVSIQLITGFKRWSGYFKKSHPHTYRMSRFKARQGILVQCCHRKRYPRPKPRRSHIRITPGPWQVSTAQVMIKSVSSIALRDKNSKATGLLFGRLPPSHTLEATLKY